MIQAIAILEIEAKPTIDQDKFNQAIWKSMIEMITNTK